MNFRNFISEGMAKANNSSEMIETIKNGRFQLDGKHLHLKSTEMGDFNGCALVSLEGLPDHIHSEFDCSMNKLTSLKGGPSVVDGRYWCNSNKLTDLIGAPKVAPDGFYCGANPLLSSLEGVPSEIHGFLECSGCNLDNLKDIHRRIKFTSTRFADFAFNRNPIKSHVLGLLKVEGLQTIEFSNHPKVEEIINKYLKGSRDILDCQEELIEAGFEEFAQL